MGGAHPDDEEWNRAAREGEDEAKRLDRNFDDLLQELRVSQNGTQIIFAFLLTVPFSNGFKTVTSFQRNLYFTTLLLAALSAAMLIAPAVMHRVLFRQHMKAELVHTAGLVALGGQALLTLTVSGAVLLIGDYLYSLTVGLVVAILVLLWWLTWIFFVPVTQRLLHRPADDTPSSTWPRAAARPAGARSGRGRRSTSPAVTAPSARTAQPTSQRSIGSPSPIG